MPDGVEITATSLGRRPLDATSDWNGVQVLGGLDLRRPWSVEEAVRFFTAQARRLLG